MPPRGAFSLGERTTTTGLSEVTMSPQHGYSRLPDHVLEYVKQLRAKKDGFDQQRRGLRKHGKSSSTPPRAPSQDFRMTSMSISGTPPSAKIYNSSPRPNSPERDVITSLAVPWRGAGNPARYPINDTQGMPPSSFMSTSSPVDSTSSGHRATLPFGTPHGNSMDSPTRSAVAALQKMLQEKDALLARLQVKVHHLESEKASAKETLQQYVVEREAAVRDLSSRLVMAQREAREVREISIQNEATMERHILALQSEVARLQQIASAQKDADRDSARLQSLPSSPGGHNPPAVFAATPSSGVEAAPPPTASVSDSSDTTELVNELRIAIESLEIRNFELRGALAAAQQSKKNHVLQPDTEAR